MGSLYIADKLVTKMPGRKNDSFTDMILDAMYRGPWWLGFFVATAFYGFLQFVIPGLLWLVQWRFADQSLTVAMLDGFIHGSRILAPFAFGLGLILWLLARIPRWIHRRRLDRQTGIDSIRQLSWRQFDFLLAEYFRRQGYRVEETADGPDDGIDLYLSKSGVKSLVQAKHWKTWRVGVRTVRELLGVMVSEEANDAWLITSGKFTTPAMEFADKNHIHLINGLQLVDMIRAVQKSKTEPDSTCLGSPQPSIQSPSCPQCGQPMHKKMARRGQHTGDEFWGCSQFPKCRGIVAIHESPN